MTDGLTIFLTKSANVRSALIEEHGGRVGANTVTVAVQLAVPNTTDPPVKMLAFRNSGSKFMHAGHQGVKKTMKTGVPSSIIS